MTNNVAGAIAPPSSAPRLRALEGSASILMRYGLVLIILWIGAFKFTAAEAEAIRPLLQHSPFLSWIYRVTDVNGASAAIGSVEIVVALLIALRPVRPGLCAIGSIAAAFMFMTTLSFLVTTPGMFMKVEWLLVPVGGGAFILKDLVLLGAALWSATEAIRALRYR